MVSPGSTMTLHYFYDPLCGWCYGAAPVMAALAQLAGVRLQLHAGGMMDPADHKTITADWRAYVMPHDQRIAQLSGQPFGDAYYHGLLNDIGAPLNSTPPIAAILAAQALGMSPLAMLANLQAAHYQDGLRIAQAEVLQARAEQQGLPREAFAAAWQEQLPRVADHVAATRQLMQRFGLQGFPSLLLEQEGQFQPLALSPWLGRPLELVAQLSARLAPVSAEEGSATFCTPERCH